MKPVPAFLSVLLLAALSAGAVLSLLPQNTARFPTQRKLVLTGHLATYGLAATLAAGTNIEVAWAWPQDALWSDQQQAEIPASAARADAVVTMRQAHADDTLYAAVRAKNFSVVEIDATVADDLHTLVVRQAPASSDDFAPAAPLSPGNAMRMAEAIAREFSRLSPHDAALCNRNLRDVKERLFRMRLQTEARLAAAENLDVGLAAPVFSELAAELGLAVHAVQDRDVRAVLATGAVADAVGPVVVLDAMAGAPRDAQHYFQALQSNLNRITAALSAESNDRSASVNTAR